MESIDTLLIKNIKEKAKEIETLRLELDKSTSVSLLALQ